MAGSSAPQAAFQPEVLGEATPPAHSQLWFCVDPRLAEQAAGTSHLEPRGWKYLVESINKSSLAPRDSKRNSESATTPFHFNFIIKIT